MYSKLSKDFPNLLFWQLKTLDLNLKTFIGFDCFNCLFPIKKSKQHNPSYSNPEVRMKISKITLLYFKVSWIYPLTDWLTDFCLRVSNHPSQKRLIVVFSQLSPSHSITLGHYRFIDPLFSCSRNCQIQIFQHGGREGCLVESRPGRKLLGQKMWYSPSIWHLMFHTQT